MKNPNSFYFALEQLHKRAAVSGRNLSISFFGLGPIGFEVEGFELDDQTVSIFTSRDNNKKVFRLSSHCSFEHQVGHNGLSYVDPQSNRQIHVNNEPPELNITDSEAGALIKKFVAIGLLDFHREYPNIDIDSLYNKGVKLKKFYKRIGFWWPSEELFLIRYHSTKGAKFCSYTMGKSHDAVKRKAARMNLKRSRDEIVFRAKDQSYTTYEIEFIKDNVVEIGLQRVAQHINRGIPGLRKKCAELGVDINNHDRTNNTDPSIPWSPEEDKFLRDNVVQIGYVGVSEKLGRTYDAVHYRAKYIKATIKAIKQAAC